MKGLVSSCIARTWPRCRIAPVPRMGLWRRPCIFGDVNIGASTDMQIIVHSTGFDLTSHTRSFVESRLVSALGPFNVFIASVTVRLEASRSRTGVVRSRAEDSRMHTAIDRAAAVIGIEVEREVLAMRRAAATPPVVGARQGDGCAGAWCGRRTTLAAPARDARATRERRPARRGTRALEFSGRLSRGRPCRSPKCSALAIEVGTPGMVQAPQSDSLSIDRSHRRTPIHVSVRRAVEGAHKQVQVPYPAAILAGQT